MTDFFRDIRLTCVYFIQALFCGCAGHEVTHLKIGISLHTPWDWRRSRNNNKKKVKEKSNRSHVKRISFHLFARLFNVTLHLSLISYARPPSVASCWKPHPPRVSLGLQTALFLSLEPLSALPPLYLTQFHTSGPLQSLLKYNHLVYSPPYQTT